MIIIGLEHNVSLNVSLKVSLKSCTNSLLVMYVTPLEAFRLGNSSRTALILEVNWSLSKHLWLKWYEKA